MSHNFFVSFRRKNKEKKTAKDIKENVFQTKPKNGTSGVPGSTVISQNVSLSEQISICLMVASVRSQLKKLHLIQETSLISFFYVKVKIILVKYYNFQQPLNVQNIPSSMLEGKSYCKSSHFNNYTDLNTKK